MIILDLDNCACNDAHRLPILACEPGPIKSAIIWDAYHAACVADTPANECLWQGRKDVIVMTGRPWKFLAHSSWWFEKHNLKFFTIFMRPSNDNCTSAVELKKNWAREIIAAGIHVDAAYDDRADIVEAYKALGLNGIQLNAHNQEWV